MADAGDTATQSGPSHPSRDQPVNRACENCRSLKVRCLPVPGAGSTGKCQRCTKTGRSCHYAAPQKRRPRKRTDTRVAELEREVRSMRSLLGKPERTPSEVRQMSRRTEREHGEVEEEPDNHEFENPASDEMISSDEERRYPALGSLAGIQTREGITKSKPRSRTQMSESFSPSSNDAIDQGLVSEDLATELFEIFRTQMLHHFPIFGLEASDTAESLRLQKPVLWLAIITAGAANKDNELYFTLHEAMLREYAEIIIIKSQKSFEIIRSMLVTSIWHHPPDDFRELKFYQYINMAAVMALDLGLGNPSGYNGAAHFKGSEDRKREEESSLPIISDGNGAAKIHQYIDDDSEDAYEARRTFLSCYWLCSGVALALRRPNMLRWTSWCRKCLQFLEDNPNKKPNDEHLIAWVKLHQLTDESGASFEFDDPSSDVNPSEPRVQITLSNFEKRIQAWKASLTNEVFSGSLEITMHQNIIFLNEFAMHDPEREKFRQPQLLDRGLLHPKPMSPGIIKAVLACIESSHAINDIIINAPVEFLRSSPVITFVKMVFSVVLLVKMSISTQTPNSEMSNILPPDTLNVDYYLKKLHAALKVASGPQKIRVPFKFLQIITKLGFWYHKTQLKPQPQTRESPKNLVQPMASLEVSRDNPQLTGQLSTTRSRSSIASAEDSYSHSTSQRQSHSPHSNADISTFNYASMTQPMMLPQTTLGQLPLPNPTKPTDLPSGTWADGLLGYQYGRTEDFVPDLMPMDMDFDINTLWNDVPENVWPPQEQTDFNAPGQQWNWNMSG